VLAAKGAFDDAVRELQYAIQLDGANPNILIVAELARTYAQAGNVTEGRRRLADLEQAHPNPAPSLAAYLAYIHAALGDTDRAFAWLESAVKNGAVVLVWAQVDPRLDPLRNDPRYRELLRRLRLLQ
jgi:tetratricopeptide (TPR) repeat protein